MKGTLIHELVHIVHGEHSAEFYDMVELLTGCLMNSLRDKLIIGECERNLASGAKTGAGASVDADWGVGHRLSSGRALPPSSAAEAALRYCSL